MFLKHVFFYLPIITVLIAAKNALTATWTVLGSLETFRPTLFSFEFLFGVICNKICFSSALKISLVVYVSFNFSQTLLIQTLVMITVSKLVHENDNMIVCKTLDQSVCWQTFGRQLQWTKTTHLLLTNSDDLLRNVGTLNISSKILQTDQKKTIATIHF